VGQEGLSIMRNRTAPLVCGAAVLVVVLAITGLRPFSRGTWLLEVLPVIVVLPVLWLTYRRFPLTSLLYLCIFVGADGSCAPRACSRSS
jgi:putative membrane protein